MLIGRRIAIIVWAVCALRVRFEDHRTNSGAIDRPTLAADLLAEIPAQVESYCALYGISASRPPPAAPAGMLGQAANGLSGGLNVAVSVTTSVTSVTSSVTISGLSVASAGVAASMGLMRTLSGRLLNPMGEAAPEKNKTAEPEPLV